jgi:hypothetical protein
VESILKALQTGRLCTVLYRQKNSGLKPLLFINNMVGVAGFEPTTTTPPAWVVQSYNLLKNIENMGIVGTAIFAIPAF